MPASRLNALIRSRNVVLLTCYALLPVPQPNALAAEANEPATSVANTISERQKKIASLYVKLKVSQERLGDWSVFTRNGRVRTHSGTLEFAISGPKRFMRSDLWVTWSPDTSGITTHAPGLTAKQVAEHKSKRTSEAGTNTNQKKVSTDRHTLLTVTKSVFWKTLEGRTAQQLAWSLLGLAEDLQEASHAIT